MMEAVKCQRKRRVKSESRKYDYDKYIIEEGLWPNSLVILVIAMRSCDPPDLQVIIYDGNLVPVYFVLAFKVPKLIQIQRS